MRRAAVCAELTHLRVVVAGARLRRPGPRSRGDGLPLGDHLHDGAVPAVVDVHPRRGFVREHHHAPRVQRRRARVRDHGLPVGSDVCQRFLRRALVYARLCDVCVDHGAACLQRGRCGVHHGRVSGAGRVRRRVRGGHMSAHLQRGLRGLRRGQRQRV